MKFTEGERRHLKSLIMDCNVYGLSQEEALQYIHYRLGKKISATWYYALKKELESDEEVQRWLHGFSRIGFIAEHRQRFNEMQLVQSCFFKCCMSREQRC